MNKICNCKEPKPKVGNSNICECGGEIKTRMNIGSSFDAFDDEEEEMQDIELD